MTSKKTKMSNDKLFGINLDYGTIYKTVIARA